MHHANAAMQTLVDKSCMAPGQTPSLVVATGLRQMQPVVLLRSRKVCSMDDMVNAFQLVLVALHVK